MIDASKVKEAKRQLKLWIIVLEGQRKDIIDPKKMRINSIEIGTLTFALTAIDENKELGNVAKSASQISENQMYEIGKLKDERDKWAEYGNKQKEIVIKLRQDVERLKDERNNYYNMFSKYFYKVLRVKRIGIGEMAFALKNAELPFWDYIPKETQAEAYFDTAQVIHTHIQEAVK